MDNVKLISKDYADHFEINDPILVSGSAKHWWSHMDNQVEIGTVVGITSYRIQVDVGGVVSSFEKVVKMDSYDVEELTEIFNMVDWMYLLK